jgi:cation:H+ antiporter
LIIGLAATAAVIKTREEMLKRDGYIMLFAAIVLYGFIISGMISRVEAVIFLLLYSAYVFFLFRAKPKFTDESGFKGFITYFFKFEYVREVINAVSDLNKRKEKRATRTIQLQATKAALLKEGVILILSCIAVIFGAHYLIVEAVFFAEFFHISKTFIGISLVAVGTSLPELSVTLSASRQGYGDIAVANVIGSNIANIFLVLGISALVFPVAIKKITILAIAPFMIFMTVLLLIFIKSDWELRRIEGIIFLILYSIFIIFFFSTSVIQ